MLALRVPVVASSGALVTLGVFSLLWYLVNVPIDVGPSMVATKIDFTRMRTDTPPEMRRDPKTERVTPPPIPAPPRVGGIKTTEPPTSFTKVTFDPVRPTRAEGTVLRPDGDVIPIVRLSPDYPPRELERGTEGWVQVRFTVTTIGTVKDTVVVDAQPLRVFDDAALKAIARWRYNPKVESGTAVERVGLQAVIRFQIDE